MHQCQECDASVKADSRWAKTRAHSDGWYFMRDGRVFCPAHRPPWAKPLTEGDCSNGP